MLSRFVTIMVVVLTISLIVGASQAADVTSKLLAYWPLDSDVKDIIGGHDGNLVGGASFVQDAKRGKVLKVDGVDGHAVVPHSNDIAFGITDSFTLSAWVYVSVLPGHWAGIVDKSRDISPWYGIWIDTSNKWVGGTNNITGSVAKPNVWIHAAYVQDTASSKRLVYIDGNVDIQGSPVDSSGAGELWMGGAKSVTEFLNGLIDDVALYGRALTPDDIAALAGGAKIAGGNAVDPLAKLTTTWGTMKQ